MKKVKNIVIAAVLFLFFAVMLVCGAIDSVRKDRDNNFREACFDAAKQEIVAEYGFDPVLWIEVEKIENLDGRDDFYMKSNLFFII